MMADCQRVVDRLAAYVDGLLPSGEDADVTRHLGACPPCRTAEQQERVARDTVRSQARELSAIVLPPGLRSRCESLARERSAVPARGQGGPAAFFSRFAPLTAVMTLVIGFFLFSLATHRSDTVLAAQLTADHAKCFRFFAGDSADADARRVEQMLKGDYGWDVHVPPSSVAHGIRLRGARRCLYVDGTVPHVMYDAGGSDVSLYVLDGVTRPPAELVSLGHRYRSWRSGTRTYVLVWPAAAGEMSAVVEYLMGEAR
jgi:anti-sigma factor RsiW